MDTALEAKQLMKEFLSRPERRDDLIAVGIWTVMLSFALISNVMILIGIVRSNAMRSATRCVSDGEFMFRSRDCGTGLEPNDSSKFGPTD